MEGVSPPPTLNPGRGPLKPTHCVEVFYALSLPLPQLETKSELRTQDLLDYFMSKSTQVCCFGAYACVSTQ